MESILQFFPHRLSLSCANPGVSEDLVVTLGNRVEWYWVGPQWRD
jgi:hypothetical protein